MSTATAGRAREYRVRDHMIAADWVLVARSAGSKGAADLIMVHPDHGLALVQVGTDNKRLGPADRTRLLTMANLCSALPIVANCAPREFITYWQVTLGPPATWEPWRP